MIIMKTVRGISLSTDIHEETHADNNWHKYKHMKNITYSKQKTEMGEIQH